MGLFGFGKKKDEVKALKNTSAPVIKDPKDLRSLDDHVQGAYDAMNKQNMEDFAVPKTEDEMGCSTPEYKEEFGEIYGCVTYNEFGYIMHKLLNKHIDDPEYALPIPYLKKQTIDDSTYFWFQLPVKDAVSITANPKTGEIVFQDKFERSEQIIVAQYDERKQGFSSVTLYDTKKRYLDKNGIDLSYAIDWKGLTAKLKEKAAECKERYGSLFGDRVLGEDGNGMELYDLGDKDRKPTPYKQILGDFPSPEEFLVVTLKATEDRGFKVNPEYENWRSYLARNRKDKFILNTAEMTWLVVNYILPQYELDSRDNKAYQDYVDTVHALREEAINDYMRRHPGLTKKDYYDRAGGVLNNSMGFKAVKEDTKYCDNLDKRLKEMEDAKAMQSNPAGYINGKTLENQSVLEELRALALKDAKEWGSLSFQEQLARGLGLRGE